MSANLKNTLPFFRKWKKIGIDFFKDKMRPAINRQYNPFANFDWGDTKWSGLAGTATNMIGNGISSAVGMDEKQKLYASSVANYGQGLYDDLSDNSSLIMAGMMPAMSIIEQKDIRDKTWGEDIGSSLMNGLNAGLSTGNPYIGIGVAALDFGNNLRERLVAKNTAEDLERQRRDRMRLLGEQYYTAAQDVDERNDFNRMMSYFENPYDYAFGGPLHSNGGDYSGGLTYIDEGGRHEENPYEGVPSGFDEEGNPNLVEEGEVIWNNDYVFSDRLKVPKELANKYKLGGKKEYTFAEAIEKLTKENKISPNDFITIATTKEIVNEFMDAQEALRQEEQIAAREELEAAQAQDFLAQLNAAQGMTPQGMTLPQMSGIPNEAPVSEGQMVPPGFALGGNKFQNGSWKDYFTTRIEDGNVIYTSPDGIDFYSEAGAKKHYDLNGDTWITPSNLIYNTPVGTGAGYSGGGVGGGGRGEYPTRPESPVEPVYSTDGRQFRGYRVKGQKTIYGSYQGAMAHVPGSKEQKALQQQRANQAQAQPKVDSTSTRKPSQSTTTATSSDSGATKINTETPNRVIPDYQSLMISDLDAMLNNPEYYGGRPARRNSQDEIVDGLRILRYPDGGIEGYEVVATGNKYTNYIEAAREVKRNVTGVEDRPFHMRTARDIHNTVTNGSIATVPLPTDGKVIDETDVPATEGETPPKPEDPGRDRKRKDTRARDAENNPLYKGLVERMDKASAEDKKKFIDELNAGLPDGKKIKDYSTWKRKATDGELGDVHSATLNYVNSHNATQANASKQVNVPDVKDTGSDLNIPFDYNTYFKDVADVLGQKPADNSTSGNVTAQEPQFSYRDTRLRYAPPIGAAMDWLYRRLNRPDYSNADRIIEAAYRMGTPINIPVETIGDYRRRNPFDERYLVAMANQNRAAAARGIANTAGGNRSMDLLGNMSLAHSNQQELGEIMRQAYLANRQDDAQVADFNRGTNVYNMNAINQRNISQAQLNTHRQQAGLSGLTQGYGLRQTIHDNWDDAAMESYNSLLASLGAIGKENEENNMLTSMAEHGYFPYYYGDRGILQFSNRYKYDPFTGEKLVAKGGKLNRKKRRF